MLIVNTQAVCNYFNITRTHHHTLAALHVCFKSTATHTYYLSPTSSFRAFGRTMECLLDFAAPDFFVLGNSRKWERSATFHGMEVCSSKPVKKHMPQTCQCTCTVGVLTGRWTRPCDTSLSILPTSWSQQPKRVAPQQPQRQQQRAQQSSSLSHLNRRSLHLSSLHRVHRKWELKELQSKAKHLID